MTKAHREKLTNGRLARLGLLDDARIDDSLAALARLRDNGIETVRVLFADQHGIFRGKTVVVDQCASVLAEGINVPSTLLLKDTANRTVFPVWSENPDVADGPMLGAGDILLVPDAATLRPLPWSSHSAWLLCDAHYRTGEPISFAPRNVLRRMTGQLADAGMQMIAGLEVEFHIFEHADTPLHHTDTTMPPAPPATRPLATGYQLLSETHYDRLEPVMDRLRRATLELGLPLQSTEVEMGPSQFEFTFAPASPLAHADNMMMFRTLVKEVAARDGLHATFMCRPRVANAAASGWHVHQSLVDRDGVNLFTPDAGQELSPAAGHWIAGLLAHARESCLLTTPTVNGYKRYQPFQLAPERIAWGMDNRGAMIRALVEPGNPASRIENRVAETAANPYLVFASQIASGLAGVTGQFPVPPRTETPYANDAQALPANLGEAITAFHGSAMYRAAFGDEVVDYLVTLKRAEWTRYLSALSEWEQAEYFGIF